jgi:hypothetical protein
MISIGLMPSSTGMVGGKQTGQTMSHYVIPGSAFEMAFEQLAGRGWKLNLQSAVAIGPGRKNKSKFTCLECGQNAWGKPGLNVICGICLQATGQIIPFECADRTNDEEPDSTIPAATQAWVV